MTRKFPETATRGVSRYRRIKNNLSEDGNMKRSSLVELLSILTSVILVINIYNVRLSLRNTSRYV